jgi:hypothetical protein
LLEAQIAFLLQPQNSLNLNPLLSSEIIHQFAKLIILLELKLKHKVPYQNYALSFFTEAIKNGLSVTNKPKFYLNQLEQ